MTAKNVNTGPRATGDFSVERDQLRVGDMLRFDWNPAGSSSLGRLAGAAETGPSVRGEQPERARRCGGVAFGSERLLIRHAADDK